MFEDGLEEAVELKRIIEIFKDVPTDHLRELAAAERDGRVMVLPDCASCARRDEKDGLAETVCDLCFGNRCYNITSNHYKAAEAALSAGKGE